MGNTPLVSVIIFAENPRFFELSLRSALQQDYANIEIIVCDATSDSVIENIAYKLLAMSPYTIHYHRCDASHDFENRFVKSLDMVKGEYIKFLFDKDVIREDCVRLLVGVLDSDTSLTIASSRHQRIGSDGQELNESAASVYPFTDDRIIKGEGVPSFFADYVINFIGAFSCTLFRKADLLSVEKPIFHIGGQSFGAMGSLVLYTKLLMRGDLVMLAQPLSQIRILDTGKINDAIDGKEFVEHSLFGKAIVQVGWFIPYKGNSKYIQIAPLDFPEQFIDFDIDEAIRNKQNELLIKKTESKGGWLAARVPTRIESEFINRYLEQNPDGRTFCIVIYDAFNDAEKVNKTLESIFDSSISGVIVKPIVLTMAENDIYPIMDGVEYKKLENLLAQSLNDIVTNVEFDWLLNIRAGECVTAGGLIMTSIGLVSAQGCSAVYGDELLRGDNDNIGASCRPDFNLDYLLSTPAIMASHWLFKREVLLELGGFDNAFSQSIEFEFIVRLIEQKGIGSIGHLAEFLTISDAVTLRSIPDEIRVLERHLVRRGYENARVLTPAPGHYRLVYNHAEKPLVSIIIPAKDKLSVLASSVTSLLEKTKYRNYELIIVDHGSQNNETKVWLDGLAKVDPHRIRVFYAPEGATEFGVNNLAFSAANGDYLLFLKSETAIIQAEWLDNMLNHIQRPEVGIVGAKLIYSDGSVQHAGMILGLRGPADIPFAGESVNSSGYMERLVVDQDYTAISAACMLIKKALFDDIGGFDEQQFGTAYGNVDLCLKAREAGYLTVWTPYAIVMHDKAANSTESVKDDNAEMEHKHRAFLVEQDRMYEKWLPVISRDPAYNINLSLNGRGFEIEPDPSLIWRPLSWNPLPIVMAQNADSFGCGHYRVIKPFNALKDAGLIDGKLANVYLSLPTMARYAPDVLICQRPTSDYFHDWVHRLSKYTGTFKVYEVDDYMPNVPLKSIHRKDVPKDILKAMRKSLGFMDRFVVSTQPLAEAFAGMHADIRVVENKLPVEWWGNLTSLRRQGKKPRVGWGGGSSHTGDLELIVDIVRDLADEVEWVFFGMCPEKLRPYIHEFYKGVPIDSYPEKLASMNLDLALAPLEDNLFNRCKSNLRLLEYGACGYPVICSDIEPYRCDLPVTRVRNRYKEWMDAIREYLSDLNETAKTGDMLKQAVSRDWMLDGDNLHIWREAWLPN
ncbi:glycosyltransferase [Musicola paradisiaca]|uniref:Glycosyl transferase family 2 n=1 Tax=Musicola paradisiaca (strain Ech703) TaxID=579405 RepID=C6C3K9_MUSP7|nr:glycosyltransferase [Musicola paradisiaca]ACS85354.1 glycosyl transferase family 2 [Musicola paradisiaca Ech703]